MSQCKLTQSADSFAYKNNNMQINQHKLPRASCNLKSHTRIATSFISTALLLLNSCAVHGPRKYITQMLSHTPFLPNLLQLVEHLSAQITTKPGAACALCKSCESLSPKTVGSTQNQSTHANTGRGCFR